eukprot:Protomagalhaensia_wolfi_Nauph_80__5956@NODE_797_length_1988_cov_142_283222_g579_i1_p1_GENE_NODE_797_length_1988_cov_142_283222_g579_i1NODE_797_length_1988_cov_142_283222_g579_i1_p1_ORF_typecomplete_len290_score33_38_NODE_797_length_1988_cov_142_283222_g579_i13251194
MRGVKSTPNGMSSAAVLKLAPLVALKCGLLTAEGSDFFEDKTEGSLKNTYVFLDASKPELKLWWSDEIPNRHRFTDRESYLVSLYRGHSLERRKPLNRSTFLEYCKKVLATGVVDCYFTNAEFKEAVKRARTKTSYTEGAGYLEVRMPSQAVPNLERLATDRYCNSIATFLVPGTNPDAAEEYLAARIRPAVGPVPADLNGTPNFEEGHRFDRMVQGYEQLHQQFQKAQSQESIQQPRWLWPDKEVLEMDEFRLKQVEPSRARCSHYRRENIFADSHTPKHSGFFNTKF